MSIEYFRVDIDESLESPVEFKGHLVKGKKGAVAVEAEQCSNVGVDSKYTIVLKL